MTDVEEVVNNVSHIAATGPSLMEKGKKIFWRVVPYIGDLVFAVACILGLQFYLMHRISVHVMFDNELIRDDWAQKLISGVFTAVFGYAISQVSAPIIRLTVYILFKIADELRLAMADEEQSEVVGDVEYANEQRDGKESKQSDHGEKCKKKSARRVELSGYAPKTRKATSRQASGSEDSGHPSVDVREDEDLVHPRVLRRRRQKSREGRKAETNPLREIFKNSPVTRSRATPVK